MRQEIVRVCPLGPTASASLSEGLKVCWNGGARVSPRGLSYFLGGFRRRRVLRHFLFRQRGSAGPPIGDQHAQNARHIQDRNLALAAATRTMANTDLRDRDAQPSSAGEHLGVHEK